MAVITNQQLLDAINGLDAKIDGVESRLDAKIDGVEIRLEGKINELDAKIDGVETRLEGKIHGVDSKISGVETRLTKKFDDLAEMVGAIGDTLAGVVDNMVTKKDLKQLESRTNARFDDLELRLGRRIDKAYTGKYEH